MVQILDIPDASFARYFFYWSDFANAKCKIHLLMLSYSTAINQLSEKYFSLSRTILRFKRIEDELTEHLTALQHEYALIKQYVFFLLRTWRMSIFKMPSSWNKVLTPSSSESALVEDVSLLERRRELMVRKAREYYREVERMKARDPLLSVYSFCRILNFFIVQKEQPIEIPVTLAQLISRKEKNLAMQRNISEKRIKLQAFQGLPPVRISFLYYRSERKMLIDPLLQNLELARHELRSAREKQMELVKLRERLLRKMAEGVE